MRVFATGTYNVTKKEDSKSHSNLRQQTLPACNPILSAGFVLPFFIGVGLACLPVGVIIIITVDNMKELTISYSHQNCTRQIEGTCIFEKIIQIDQDFEGDVMIYYGLTKFHQNHRRYYASKDRRQLAGHVEECNCCETKSNVDAWPCAVNYCAPYVENSTTRKRYAPCGAIANSFFSDIITLRDTGSGENVPLDYRNIAASGLRAMYSNPDNCESLAECKTALYDYQSPADWPKARKILDRNKPIDETGFRDEDLIVWMQSSAFPNFRKLYRRLLRQGKYRDGLPAGSYTLVIENNFLVTNGTKKIVLATTSWFGAKNPFLGYTYCVVGMLCLLLAVLQAILHYKMGMSLDTIGDVEPF